VACNKSPNTMCNGGQCAPPSCAPQCAPNETCCYVDGPGPSRPPQCVQGVTCPAGCPACG
jgi:hypothetical protein